MFRKFFGTLILIGVVQTLFGKIDTLHQQQFDSLIIELRLMGQDSFLVSDSSSRYVLEYQTSCAYSEMYGLRHVNLFQEDLTVISDSLYTNDSLAGYIWLESVCKDAPAPPTDTLLRTVAVNNLMPSRKWEAQMIQIDRPLGLMGWEGYSAVSFGEGKYIVTEGTVILQHGGQTSWGVRYGMFLKRVSDK